MKKTVIIHSEKAWDQAMGTYEVSELDTPPNFPVILVLNVGDSLEGDTEAMDIPGGVVITPEMAAKLLANTSLARLAAMPQTIRAELHNVFKIMSKADAQGGMQVGVVKPKPLTVNVPQAKTTVIDEEGNEVTLQGAAFSYKVGDKIQMNGQEWTVSDVGTSLSAVDPITGQEGIIEINEEELQPQKSGDTIPGMEKIPLDPSKFDDPSKRIAELGDPTEHVLDVERAI